MKSYIRQPINAISYALRTTAIISTIGIAIGAGYLFIKIENLINWWQEQYGIDDPEDNY